MIIIAKLDWKKALAFSALVSLLAIVLFIIFKPASTGTEYVASLNYTALFIIGALLAKYRSYISHKFNSLSVKVKISVFAFGIATYLFVHPSFVIKALLFQNIPPFYRTVIDSWFITLGAVILIIFTLNSARLSRMMRHFFVIFLGKISYSLYLVHVVIILTVVQTLYGRGLPIGILLSGSLLVSLFIASMMYFFIEKPSIWLGRVLTKSKKMKLDQIKS
ncbi:acyltransferase family protein [Paenibacillus marchantiophytorum]|uniref:acyltransferase family protein n=1 Tax=Paenibacillus marchantiophytorum TaxID=1619310 RepID=UPI003570EBA1